MKNLIPAIIIALVFSACSSKYVSLFDGKTINGWHTWNQTDVKGWHVMNGALMTHGNSGDLVTDKEYENFILEFEFNVEAKGNSGVIYKVLEDKNNKAYFAPYASAPEYQIIDDLNYGEPIKDTQKTAANYDIQAPNNLKIVKPAGQWNSGKIVVNRSHVEHWLNGVKVVEYEYGTDAWKASVAKSKFASWAYATPHAKGKIALQDHGHAVSFRNVKIQELN